MVSVHLLPAFLLTVVLIAASPGPAMALIIRRAALHGTRTAVPVVLGVEFGLYVWAILAGAGFAAFVAASEVAYTVLRIGGAVVLTVLGVLAWRAALSHRGHEGTLVPASGRSWRGGFAQGALTNLANPKAAVFMFAFYPQFIPAGQPALPSAMLLGLIQIAIEATLYLSLAAGVARAGAWFSRGTIRRRFEAASGTVLIGLAAKVALTSR